MSTTLFNDESADRTLHFAVRHPSDGSTRPVTMFAEILVIIFVCEAAIMILCHILQLTSKWAIILDPLLLIVLSAICLYRFIVSPMSRMLELNKEVEGKLELFRGLIDKSNDAIFIIEPETAKFLDVNYKAYATLGYTRDELRNMTVMDIEELIKSSSVWAEYVGKVRNNGYAFLQGRQKRKDGTTFPVEVNSNLINLGHRDYMVAVARDVSERERAQVRLKESETKFRKLAECAKDAIIMMGPNGEISFWNPSAEKIFGYSRDEAIGKNLHTLLVPKRFHDAFQRGFATFQKTGQGNAVGKTLRLAAMRRDGSEFNMELSVSTVYLDGKWHAVGIVRDVSERKETETDLVNQSNAAGITTETAA